MNKEMVAIRLELVAAKTKQLAEDLKNGRLWPGDLDKGITEAMIQLREALQDATP